VSRWLSITPTRTADGIFGKHNGFEDVANLVRKASA
jgi:hypothetical protein